LKLRVASYELRVKRGARSAAGGWRSAKWVALLAIVIMALAGCRGGGGNPPPDDTATAAAMHGANPARTGVYDTEPLREQGEIKWQFEATDWFFGVPAVDPGGNAVYATNYDGKVYALNRANGAELWQFTTDAEIIASPAAADGLVFVAGMDGNVYGLKATDGTEQWRVAVGGGFIGSPAVVDVAGKTLVLAGAENGVVVALEAQTGAEQWRFEQAGLSITYSVAVADGSVYVPVSDGVLHVLDAGTGEEQWRYDPNSPTTSYNPTADVVIADGVAYLMTASDITASGVLHAVDLSTHVPKWLRPTPAENFSAPSTKDGMLYFGGTDRVLYAVAANTGEVVWSFPTEDILFGAPAIAGDLVYVGGADSNLYALDAISGEVRWQFRADSAVSSPAVADGVIYVGTDGGVLYAID